MTSSSLAGSDQPARSDRRARVLLWNSFANVIRAGSTSLVTIVLPLMLVLMMPVQNYAVWALMFGIASYSLYLDLGMQSTVQALVGRFDGANNPAGAAQVGRAALKVAGAIVLLCAVAAIALAIFLPEVFPDIPRRLQSDAQVVLLLLLVGQLSSLAGSIIASYFAGLQRSMEATAIIAPSRLVSMCGALIAAGFSLGLIATAALYCVPLLVGALIIIRRFFNVTRTLKRDTDRTDSEDSPGYLLRYSGPLIVWNLCMLVVTGVGIALVGRLDYELLPVYAVAATVVAGIGGIVNALLQPLLPELSRRHNEGAKPEDLGRIVLYGSRLNGLLLACITVGLLAFGPLGLEILLAGEDYSSSSFLILMLLTIGSAARLVTAPLSLAFVATQTHTRVIIPPVLEAIINLSCSIMFGFWIGAVGVALGFCVGAFTCLILTFTWSLKLSGAVGTSSRQLFTDALIRPLASVTPAIVGISLAHTLVDPTGLGGILICALGILLSLPFVWYIGLPERTRQLVLVKWRRVKA